MNINSIKKAVSYIWPIISKVESQHNGTLEVTWYDGKKMLNSKNANYSYGKLEKALVFGLSKLNIKPAAPILILGLGGGSIIRPLRNRFGCTGSITAVEWDEVVLNLSKTEFGVNDSLCVDMVLADAFSYVKGCEEVYGLIVIDLFLDITVPKVFYGHEFWGNVLAIIESGGSILFNAGLNNQEEESVKNVVRFLQENSKIRILANVEGSNTLMLVELY